MSKTKKISLGLWLVFLLQLMIHGVASFDYGVALTKSLLFYESQRSGLLPPNQRATWRGNSGLRDGGDSRINLVGGYYDAGDNVKFGFPMAYTITMLAWGAVEFEGEFSARNELTRALEAIKWGTDYIIKAHPQPDILYAEVGDGNSDHQCWQRPEDMTTPRTSYKIDDQHPGSDLAGESAAALAASSIAFSKSDPKYSSLLLFHAKQLFEFAKNHQGLYSNSIPVARTFYSSSGFQDELLWAAVWLHRATGNEDYMRYVGSCDGTGGVRSMFSWDDKYVGVQALVAKMVLEGKLSNSGKWAAYKSQVEGFICNCVQKGNSNVRKSPGGLLWWQAWNNLQYTASATFISVVYSKYLTDNSKTIQCQGGPTSPGDLIASAKSQVDYILGQNPKSMSYMVGFGSRFASQVHHRGASIVSIKKNSSAVSCKGGFDAWFHRNAPNPNVLEGAIVGGPYDTDEYTDSRSNYQQAEPATANNAPLVGVLAKLSSVKRL